MSTPPVVAPPMHSFAPSFRPLGAPPPPPPPQQVQVQVPPQYGGVPNPGYPMAQQMQPPGVPHVMPPGAVRPPAMYAPQPGVYLQQPGAALPPGGSLDLPIISPCIYVRDALEGLMNDDNICLCLDPELYTISRRFVGRGVGKSHRFVWWGIGRICHLAWLSGRC
jgi:hypothetical protein